jgi:plasmid stabilization system protein ParE
MPGGCAHSWRRRTPKPPVAQSLSFDYALRSSGNFRRPGVVPGGQLVRELLVLFGQGGYVLRYRADADVVAILAVRHGREKGFTVD